MNSRSVNGSYTTIATGWLGWLVFNGAFNTRSYRAFKIELNYKYHDLISINSWGKIIQKEKYRNNSIFRLNK